MSATENANETLAEAATPLVERLGGAPALAEIVADLFRRVTADPELGVYFRAEGADAPHSLGNRQFSLFAAHVADVLEARHVGPDEADLVLGWVAQGRRAVVADG